LAIKKLNAEPADQETSGSDALCCASDFVWNFLTVITVEYKYFFVLGWQKYVMMAYNTD